MTGTAKRGISNAIAMAACAVCLVAAAAAAVVMVPSGTTSHRQADQLAPFQAPVSRVSIGAAWDAARVFAVALADLDSQRKPACTGHTTAMSPAGRSDGCSLRGIDVPAPAARDAFAGIAAFAVQGSLADVQTCSRQSAAAEPGHGMVTYPRHTRAQDVFAHALDAGRLHDPAIQVMASTYVGEADSPAVATPAPGKADTRFCRFHSRELCTYRVTV